VTLDYATARAVDDFVSGQAPAETEFWVRITAEPTIDDKHRTVVAVELGVEGAQQSIVSLCHETIRAYPSTLHDLDAHLIQGWSPGEWLLVHVEKPYPDKPRTRRYMIYAKKDRSQQKLGDAPPPSAERQADGPTSRGGISDGRNVQSSAEGTSPSQGPYKPQAGGGETAAEGGPYPSSQAEGPSVPQPQGTPPPAASPGKQQPCGHPKLDRVAYVRHPVTGEVSAWKCSVCGHLYEEAG
jgi:hypothetical protein